MFVADVKCSQAKRQTVPNSRTGSAKTSVSETVVRTNCRWWAWDRPKNLKCVSLTPKGPFPLGPTAARSVAWRALVSDS